MTPPVIGSEPSRTDTVTAVLIAMDGVTRRPVIGGVSAELTVPHRRRLVRNLRGQLVLLNERPDQELTFTVAPEAAGYRTPPPVTFNPARDGVVQVVALERDLAGSFEGTVVRGTVRQAGPVAGPVAGATVSATPPAALAGRQFPATTDARGSFALVVGLRLSGVEEPAPIQVRLRFEGPEGANREFQVDLEPGRRHVFARPVELDGHDVPELIQQAMP
jgi:hypothetical protein